MIIRIHSYYLLQSDYGSAVKPVSTISRSSVTGIPESEGNKGSDVLCPGTRVLEQGEQQGRGWICAVDC